VHREPAPADERGEFSGVPITSPVIAELNPSEPREEPALAADPLRAAS